MSYEDWYPRNYPATLSNFLSSNIVIIFFIPKTPPLPPPPHYFKKAHCRRLILAG